MKVKEIMTPNPKACSPTTTLSDVAHLMWDYDCGIVPVVQEGGKVVGLITDRDICMAAAMQNRNLSNIAVEDVISGDVFACRTEDDVRQALDIMRHNKVRRLPVLDEDELLIGVLSLNDIARKVEDGKNGKRTEVAYRDVIKTYKSICEPRGKTSQALTASA